MTLSAFQRDIFLVLSVQLHCNHVNVSAGGTEVLLKKQLVDANYWVGGVRKVLSPSQLSGWRIEQKNPLTFWPRGSDGI